MVALQQVLVVDQCDETREVLRTALKQKGMSVLEASAAEAGLELAQRHHPDLIVLDLELQTSQEQNLSAGYAAQSQADQAHIIVLGTARQTAQELPTSQFVAKPYHYAPLIRKIVELLETSRPQTRAA